MPVFEYRCTECGAKYDVLHKSAKSIENVTCPKCNSANSKKLFSTFNSAADGTYSFVDSKSAKQTAPASSCACGTGGCGIN
ncbi:MAG: zinc ribbon domain-containing protein [Ignavibacteriaceae bacterium]|nr:zinc ribbon domain-containing protein [Ignavibacteriaceae bacterium]